MATVATRGSGLFTRTTSVSMTLEDDELGEDGSSHKSLSRVRKLSKRLSATFKSSFSLRETDDAHESRHQNEALKHRKKPLGRVLSLQHFTDTSMFKEETSRTNEYEMQQIQQQQQQQQQPHPSSTIQSQSSMNISNLDKHDRLRRVMSVPENGSLKRMTSPYGKLEHYTKLEQLGEGSYATVFKGVSKKNNIFVALKEIRLQQDEGIPFTAIREASLLKGLKHSNIVRLHDIIPSKEHLVLVFEYLHTDLCIYLEERPFGAHPSNAKLLLFQLLRGLQYIHKKKILHRDIKPQNVLLSNRGELKLADFGLARAKSVPSRTYTHEIVTLWYRPPDVLLGSTVYTTSLDIWGVGCIFVEMLSGFPLFPGVKSTRDQLNKIFKVCGSPNEDDWPVVKTEFTRDTFEGHPKLKLCYQAPKIKTTPYAEELAEKMLQINPRNRVSAVDAMRHIYFADLPKGIFTLPDGTSLFTVPGVKMVEDMRSTADNSVKTKAKSFGQFV